MKLNKNWIIYLSIGLVFAIANAIRSQLQFGGFISYYQSLPLALEKFVYIILYYPLMFAYTFAFVETMPIEYGRFLTLSIIFIYIVYRMVFKKK